MPGGGKKAVFPTLALHDHEQVRITANEQDRAKRFHQSRVLPASPGLQFSHRLPHSSLIERSKVPSSQGAKLPHHQNHSSPCRIIRKSSDGGKDSPDKETAKPKTKTTPKTEHPPK